MAKKSSAQEIRPTGEIEFHYANSNLFRAVVGAGVIASIGPSDRTIHAGFFNERLPTPEKDVYSVKNGKLGQLKSREAKSGVVREIEVEVVMSIERAETIAQVILAKVKDAKRISAKDK